MTIVGYEKQTDGSRNIIVFDPMFHDATNVMKLIGKSFTQKAPGDLLKAYRRGAKYLKKYDEFELLKYDAFSYSHRPCSSKIKVLTFGRLTPPKTNNENDHTGGFGA